MSKISELVKFAKTDTTNFYQEINFGIIPNFQAQTIASQTGVIVKGAKRYLSTIGIRHAITGHSNHKLESERGQIGITDTDFENIPDILNNYQQFERGNKHRNGSLESVVFIKTIGHKEYHIAMSINKSKENLKLVFSTMFIKNKSR